ncbi:hypothetical protein [Methylomonas sp. AM2-LC]|uniref:hypothetical protein n=1 Tax=Methylomonas sp. AM2-LC TaxID=3153301 RepID=UPI003266A81B
MAEDGVSLSKAEEYNSACHCLTLNRKALEEQLSRVDNRGDLYRMLIDERPHLIANSAVFVNKAHLNKQLEIIWALEKVIAMPAFQKQVLNYAPQIAQFQPKAFGAFVGYDFHLAADGPKLIEINSNAGGPLINSLISHAQHACCKKIGSRQFDHANLTEKFIDDPENSFIAMFYQEWQAERGTQPLHTIAIVDDEPNNQYLLPEFILFKHLFEQQGICAVICDPSELHYHNGAIWHGALKIDLIYNRLTDFSLEQPKLESLRAAYLASDVVLTPHPRNHAIYADKRNLTWLCNTDFLERIGVETAIRDILIQGIAHTEQVNIQKAEILWSTRKSLFFKPCRGFGSKAAYRGDKLTKQVFSYILENDYVAQTLIKPSERHLEIGQDIVKMKLDLRHYVYKGQTQLICARLYQGQTTNFRTPGGGFAPVVII